MMIAALRRLSGTLFYVPDNALGDGAPNLLSAPEFAGGVADAPTRSGLVTLSSMAGYDNALAFGHDGVTTSVAYKSFATTVGLTYTLSVVVRMDDGNAPTFGSATGSAASNPFALVLHADQLGNPLTYTVVLQSDGSYRVSGTTVATSTATNVGIVKYNTNNNRTFKVTGYKLEPGSTATAYTPQSVLRQRGAYTDIAGTTPVTAVGDLFGLLLDRCGTVGTPVIGLATAWQSLGAGHSLSGGVMTLTAAAASSYSLKGLGLIASKTYRFDVSVPALSGGTVQVQVGGGSVFTIATAGNYSFVLKPTTIDGPYIAVSSGTVTAQITRLDWVELTGNRATQSAVASKPSVQRVPKRLGPNLVSNGTFDSGTTGWTNSSTGTGTFTVSAGVATITGTDGANRGALAQQLTGLNVGATYTVTFTATGSTSSFNIQTSATPGAGVVSAVLTTAGRMTVVATATSLWVVAHTAAGGGTTTIDNIVVQEVLEWSYAISFADNDYLQTGITTGNEGWVCAGVTPIQVTTAATVFNAGAGSDTQKGIWLYIYQGQFVFRVGNGTERAGPGGIAATAGIPVVVSGGWTASSVVFEKDTTAVTTSRSGDCTSPTALQFGAYLGGTLALSGPMHAIAYTPVLPDAATRKIIRNGIAALQGRTL